MLTEMRNKNIELEEMTGLQFTQLMSEWKQELFRMGAKDINKLEITVLEKCLEAESSKEDSKIKTLIVNYLSCIQKTKVKEVE